MALTSDPTDPRLTRGADPADAPYQQQADVYLVLSEEQRAKGFIRPVRLTYVHEVCGGVTTMPVPIAETYAANPSYYGATYCTRCGLHRPVGPDGEFYWADGLNSKVGT